MRAFMFVLSEISDLTAFMFAWLCYECVDGKLQLGDNMLTIRYSTAYECVDERL
jgi:hypothetical protein